MLVVTRKKDEKLMIGNEIEVQILKIGKDSVRIGIKAPESVSVHRFEVYESILASNVAATKSRPPHQDLLKNLIKVAKEKSSEQSDE
jgi:carbon storage regulator